MFRIGLREFLTQRIFFKVAAEYPVSTFDQEPENQLQELRCYVEVRGWQSVKYVDRGVPGAKDRRPALDQMIADAKRRRFEVLVAGVSIDSVGTSST